jgi:uncharacterized membrane protein
VSHHDWRLFAVAAAVGLVTSGFGGLAGGVLVGGEALGRQLAALMGGFYGNLAGFLGVLLGLVVLAFFG